MRHRTSELRRPAAVEAGASRRPVIWTVSVTRLSALLRDVMPEFDHRAHIEPISLGFEEAVGEIRRRLEHEHCDVIVAAGSNGAYLKNRVDRPVVLIRPGGFDLMQALTQARKLSPHIGVITHESEIPVFAAFQRSFGLAIEQRVFVTAEEARHAVAELVAGGVKVIIGTGMAVELAEQAGVAGILLYTADAVREAFESALDLARMLALAGAQPPEAAQQTRRSARAPVRYRLGDLAGNSAPMRRLRDGIARVAGSEATVLIDGATGSGKELTAQAIHAQSRRRAGPFVAVNCGAIAESLLESELFGYDEGSFTGARRGGRAGLIEAADGGTLFLDEIGEMPLALQTRLLRVLEEREVMRVGASRPHPVDVRFIAATHCDLDAMTAAGRFRRDLYYRLAVLRLPVPGLAERREDVPMLLERFIRESLPGARLQCSAEALAALKQHAWPGNVRELRNLAQRIAAQWQFDGKPGTVDEALLRDCAPELFEPLAVPPAPEEAMSLSLMPPRRRPGREELQRLLRRVSGDRKAACAALGVSRATLWRWLRDAGVEA